jgi:hypothetical protein
MYIRVTHSYVGHPNLEDFPDLTVQDIKHGKN